MTRDGSRGDLAVGPQLAVTASSSGINCNDSACVVETIRGKERYVARSSDGKDTDRITLLPR